MANEKSRQGNEDRTTASESAPEEAIARDQEIRRIIHQLNQPLTAINNYAQAGSRLLENGKSDPENIKGLFDKIIAQCSRTNNISQELSDTMQSKS